MERLFVPYDAVPVLDAASAVVLAPHPDDEVFGCGATLAAMRARGVPVQVLVLSDGATAEATPALVERRREESRRAAALLGYPAPTFWDLPDGGLADVPDLAQRILAWIRERDPELVLAPSCWEMHRDHRAVAQAAIDAVLAIGGRTRLAMYEIGVPMPMPGVLVDIGRWRALKAAAMSCFVSQIGVQDYPRQVAALNAFRTYTLAKDAVAAEAFAVFDAQALRELNAGPLARELSVGMRRAADELAEAARLRSEAQRELLDARQTLARVLGERDAAQAALAQTADELAAERAARERMELSRSWRVTAPLRALARRARQLRETMRGPAAPGLRGLYRRLPIPAPWKAALRARVVRLRAALIARTSSRANRAAAAALLEHRAEWLLRPARLPAPLAGRPRAEVAIDVTVVTFDSAKWLPGLVRSLLAQTHPTSLMALTFVDNGSSDATVETLLRLRDEHAGRFAAFRIVEQDNRGFGAGHNRARAAGTAPFVLVTNPDLEFEADAIARVVALAASDEPRVACWELRQKPYEHPKHYDPVTWETTWCSHACVLMRRGALDAVGGYDERIFLYGEDVELSYRLRAAGWRLRYCPDAVVWHHTYASAAQLKPRQYVGSLIANLYLRLRYGDRIDALMAAPLLMGALARPAFPGARRALLREARARVAPHALALLREQRADPLQVAFPFRGFDYEFARRGAFVEGLPAQAGEPPLVSIVTRTVAGRGDLLRQAGFSVFHQTHPRIEWIVVEDGGRAQAQLVTGLAERAPCEVRYEALPKLGRSAAGNRGLELARGRYAMFLDDDDLLYADHVETLVGALLREPGAAAAYALAWQVPTSRGPDGRLVEDAYEQVASLEQDFDFELLRARNYIPIQSIVFERRLFAERGGFDTALDQLEDWNLWQRYAAGERFLYVPKTTSLYRVPSDATTLAARQSLLDAAYREARGRADRAIEAIGADEPRSAAR